MKSFGFFLLGIYLTFLIWAMTNRLQDKRFSKSQVNEKVMIGVWKGFKVGCIDAITILKNDKVDSEKLCSKRMEKYKNAIYN